MNLYEKNIENTFTKPSNLSKLTMALGKINNNTEITNSLIGVNSYFTGKFHINGSLTVDGSFEGKSLQAEQLYIGPTGRVKTDLKANNVIVEGVIIGNITASNRIMLLPTAKVLGDIRTPELIIQNGVILEGRCTISHDFTHTASEFIQAEYNKQLQHIPEKFKTKNQSLSEKS